MDRKFSIGRLLLLLSLTSLLVKSYSSSKHDQKTYIVYTGNIKNDETSSLSRYENMLQQVTKSNSTPKRVLHHYKRSFVANLTEEEAEKMAGLDGVVSLFPNEKIQLLTTRSWDFIGFPEFVEREQSESNVIIGVLDSGIWPESKSFDDKGYSSPPSQWKGVCQASDFCNNKIVGARYYNDIFGEDFLKKTSIGPRDTVGHGTHVASIAAGNPISKASMLGMGEGTARGGASSARIAVYKVCWTEECDTGSILNAFKDAIADGVDILSVSIGGSYLNKQHFTDPFSVGAFLAMKHGILTVFAAGNRGPDRTSVQHISPWAISVAASTLDRKFVTKVILGDGTTYEGNSINTFDLKGKLYPLIYSGDAPNKQAGFDTDSSRNCSTGSLDHKLVKGKIVLCEGNIASDEAVRVGAVGVLMQGHTYMDSAISYPLSASLLHTKDARKVHKYIRSSSTPMATILKTNEFKDNLAPVVASFSSRGPNNATPEILKPDLIAPGVDIVASWSPMALISNSSGEKRKLMYNIISGTSMACPHVSGAAAYIKTFHPEWSPAALRSALMTTAKQISPDGAAEFAYGAGQIDPIKALEPGLIYETNEVDYIRFLCGQGFNASVLKLITEEYVNCSEIGYISATDLNYPSFAFKAPRPKHHLSGSFKRTVTNVGLSTSTYKAIIRAPKGLHVSVNPNVLPFTSLGEKQTFVLTVHGKLKGSIRSASLVWDDGTFQVRSPIVVFDERAEKGKGINLYRLNYMFIVMLNLLFYIVIIE